MKVFPAENSDMRLEDLEKFKHDGADSAEMAGARAAAESETDAGLIHPTGEVGPVHLVRGRSKQEIDAMFPAKSLVFDKRAGITGEVLFGPELGWIDKDGCDDRAVGSGDGAGAVKKRGVPPVQCAHGWNEDTETGCSQADLMGPGIGADGVQSVYGERIG